MHPHPILLPVLIGLWGAMASCSKPSSNVDYSDAREEIQQVREIAWTGRTLQGASYWVNGKPIGTGMNGYEALTKLLEDTKGGSQIVVRGFLPDMVAISDRYPAPTELPFADDTEDLVKFYNLLGRKQFILEPSSLKSLDGLPPQKK